MLASHGRAFIRFDNSDWVRGPGLMRGPGAPGAPMRGSGEPKEEPRGPKEKIEEKKMGKNSKSITKHWDRYIDITSNQIGDNR